MCMVCCSFYADLTVITFNTDPPLKIKLQLFYEDKKKHAHTHIHTNASYMEKENRIMVFVTVKCAKNCIFPFEIDQKHCYPINIVLSPIELGASDANLRSHHISFHFIGKLFDRPQSHFVEKCEKSPKFTMNESHPMKYWTPRYSMYNAWLNFPPPPPRMSGFAHVWNANEVSTIEHSAWAKH